NAMRQALERPRYEIIPMRGALAQARKLPAGATISVTCSPNRGVEATVALAEQINSFGYKVIPHLAAKRFASQTHLNDIMIRLADANIRHIFVVGGDGDNPVGPFSCGADILAALVELQPDLESIGVPCYPEGHASLSSPILDAALDAKSHYVHYMVSQICFDAGVIGQWLSRIREHGIKMPLLIGMPGVIERRKLLGIAMRIGLGDSTRFLRKNTGL